MKIALCLQTFDAIKSLGKEEKELRNELQI